MAAVIRDFKYSKTGGRGRGILGLKEFSACRKPGALESDTAAKESERGAQDGRKVTPAKLVVALYDYNANAKSPGGFNELTLKKGQLLKLLGEHPDNEHWWEVKNEDEETGFVPSSYIIVKEEQALPWLQASALKSEEEERKERVKRLNQQKDALDGVGFGPAPKGGQSSLPPRQYVSAYNRDSNSSYYCKVCDKQLNGPKPYQAHMASKAHKEELALAQS